MLGAIIGDIVGSRWEYDSTNLYKKAEISTYFYF